MMVRTLRLAMFAMLLSCGLAAAAPTWPGLWCYYDIPGPYDYLDIDLTIKPASGPSYPAELKLEGGATLPCDVTVEGGKATVKARSDAGAFKAGQILFLLEQQADGSVRTVWQAFKPRGDLKKGFVKK